MNVMPLVGGIWAGWGGHGEKVSLNSQFIHVTVFYGNFLL